MGGSPVNASTPEATGAEQSFDVSELESSLGTPFHEDGNQGTDPSAAETDTEGAESAETSQEAEPEGQPPTEDGEGEADLEASQDTSQEDEEEQRLSFDRLLPLEQFGKDEEIPERLLKASAQKWKIPEEELNKPWAQALLRDKINSDIYLKNERFDRELAEFEAKAEEADKEPEDKENPTPSVGMAEVLGQMGNFVAPLITDEGSKAFAESMGQAWGKLSEAQESGDEKKILEAQRNLTAENLKWASVGTAAMLEKMLPQLVTKQIEGIINRQNEIQSIDQAAIESLANDPKYSDVLELLESGKMDAVFEEFPELHQKQFKGADGKPLPQAQNRRKLGALVLICVRWQ